MRKEGSVQKSASVAEMEKINRYTRREYHPEEVYTFSLVLCDNEVDRDGERFSIEALKGLRELFLGKTCIFDHERKSANQTARIYDTAVETVPGRMTRCGEEYTRLTAQAYLPRTEKTGEMIELIESGILKEVSIGCAVKKVTCSVCGKESCSHEAGKVYGGVLCCWVLSEPQDAYECSFVAVPAQREAGVRKGYHQTEKREAELLGQIETLKSQAAWGQQYRDALIQRTLTFCAIAQPQLPRDVMQRALQSLEPNELSTLCSAYEKSAQHVLPLQPQLAPQTEAQKQEQSNRMYQI